MSQRFITKSARAIRKVAAQRVRRAALTRVVGATVLVVSRAFADDTIVDPELSGTPNAAPSAPASKPATESTAGAIEDPELSGSGPAAPIATGATGAPSAATVTPTPARPTEASSDRGDTVWRLSLHSRWGIGTNWASPSQDIIEGTTVAGVEATQRRSESLMFSVGLRARHAVGFRKDGKSYEQMDFAPISGFVDVTPVDGYHVRAGYQIVQMGRFDILTATNFLAIYDLRSGSVTMPEAAAIAQPALRFDFDKISGFSLQAYYLPFFQPDLVNPVGTNYSLPLDRTIDQTIQGAAQPNSPIGPTVIVDPRSTSAGRSSLVRGSTALFQAATPAPDFTTPQGSLRATFSGAAGELSGTIGTALERIPVIVSAPPIFTNPNVEVPPGFALQYNRFWVASVDGATDAGPFQLGAEVAYMANRTFYAVIPPPKDGQALPQRGPVPDRMNMLHGGLRAELAESNGVSVLVETMVEVALNDPTAIDPSWGTTYWQNFEAGRWFGAIAGGVQWAPERTRLKFELGGVALTGFTYAVLPRIEWEAVRTLFFELGGAFVGGPTPPVAVNAQIVSLGGLYSNVDQVFVGARWTP